APNDPLAAWPYPRDQLGVADLAREPVAARLLQDGPLNRAFQVSSTPTGNDETHRDLLDGRVQDEDEDAAAPGVAPRDEIVHLLPALAAHRGELPPLRVDADLVDAVERARDGPVVARGLGGRDHLEEQLVAALLHGAVQGAQ